MDNQILGVLCINCNSVVSVDNIEQHSQQCYYVSQEVQEHQETPYASIQQIVSFREFLINLSENKIISPTDKNILLLLQRFVGEFLDDRIAKPFGSDDSWKSCRAAMLNITNLQNALQDNISIVMKIYFERLLNLLQEYSVQIPKSDGKPRLGNRRFYAQQQNSLYPIDSIQSNLGSNSLQSAFSGYSSATESVASNEDFSQDLSQTSMEPQKKFYQECMKLKLNMSSKNLAQKVPLKALWDNAVRNQIQPEKWEQFIYDQLSQPQTYLSSPQQSRRQRRIQVKSPKIKFNPILEED